METKERRRYSGTRTRSAKRPPSQARRREEVVYTAPGPFKKERFILQLLTVVAVVLALVFGMSIFFKVDEDQIMVSFKSADGTVLSAGQHKYTELDIVEAAEIKDGENLLTIRESEISGRILDQLPYVVKVRVRIKLPDSVNIEIVETDVVYSVEAADGTWWFIRADGKVLEKTNPADAEQKTVVTGVKLASPVAGEQAVAFEPEQPTQEATTETTLPVVTAAEQLRTLLEILTSLESNGVIGTVVSIDVSNLNGLSLWYGDRYEVYLGDNTNLQFKIGSMIAAIKEMKSYQTGKLDVSFTTMEDQVIYTPFE